MLKKVLSILFHPLLLATVAVIIAAVLIWWVGPLVSVGQLHPFDSETARWITICVLVALVLLRCAWVVLRAVWRNRMLADGLLGAAARQAPAPRDEPSAGQQEVSDLARRFDRAIAALRDARLSAAGRRPGWRDWLSLSGRQYLYRLPWYILIGSPGSGKTTALEYSGLSFPLADKFALSSTSQTAPGAGWHANRVAGIGGTRNCDWWFTDRAVLIDTAGRYTTQDSDFENDRTAWHGFLSLLKKTRPRTPINGVLLTVSVSELLGADDAKRAQMAATLRARIHELAEQLETQFPVYVLVTKTDLLAGFSAFFADLDSEERAQVLGFTLPYTEGHASEPSNGAASAAVSDEALSARMLTQFEALGKRLVARVLARADTESNVSVRAEIIGFPQQFAAFAPLLTSLLCDVFIQSHHREGSVFRGVYFTSGTQQGTPIDCVVTALARAFRFERRALPPQRASGRSFFIKRTLADVVFAEQGLAGGNLRLMRRRHLRRLAGYSAIVLAAALVVGLWSVSFLRNSAYVATVEGQARSLRTEVAAAGSGSNPDIVALLPLLTAVRDAASTRTVDAGAAPLPMQWGLWQGTKLEDAADAAYRRLLGAMLLPRLAARIETQLRSTGPGNPAFAYEALKTYLMLNQPEHQDTDALKTWIVVDWDHDLPHEVSVSQRAELVAHLDALLSRGAIHSSLPFDPALVARTRALVLGTPLAQQVYGRIKQRGIGGNCRPFTVAEAAGPNAPLVFVRINGEPLTQGVPGLYTYGCYHQTFLPAIDGIARQLIAEAPWVLGIANNGEAHLQQHGDAALHRLGDEVRLLYLEDFVRLWQTYVGGVHLVRAADLAQSAQIARILSAQDSPLVMLTRAVSRETTLGERPQAEQNIAGKAAQKFDQAKITLRSIIGEDDPAANAPTAQGATPESLVDNRFAALHSLVAAPANGQPPPIAAMLSLLNDVYVYLSATDSAIQQKVDLPQSDVLARLRASAQQMPAPVHAALADLAQSAALTSQEAKRKTLSADMKQTIASYCQSAIDGRYPFTPGASADVLPEDFGALFAPGGKLDAFFQKNLAADVDVSARPWAFKKVDDTQRQTSPAGLADFERADVIRSVFFPKGGKTPSLTLTMKPVEMDATILRFVLDVDGQLISYEHGPQLAMSVQWPGTRGISRISIQLTPPPSPDVGNLTFDGPWALFRMFDRVTIAPTSQPERFFATFDFEGRHVRFEVTANSVENPFGLAELRAFRCPDKL